MKKLTAVLALITLICVIAVSAQDTQVIKIGISMIDSVPKELFGTWKVSSILENTDSPKSFQKTGINLWNLSRQGNVINLRNPITGAAAEVVLNVVGSDYIKFSSNLKTDNMILTDTVEIKIAGDTFSGYNILTMSNYSVSTNKVLNTKQALYKLTGQKISGNNIVKD